MKLLETIKEKLTGKVPLFYRRSSKWPTVREHFLKSNPACAACGQTDHLQVHHIRPFHLDPSLELNTGNLITLCEDEYLCHLKIGHLGSFKKENPEVRKDAAEALRKHIKDKVKTRSKARSKDIVK